MTSDVPEAEHKHVDLVEALGGKRGLVDGGLPGAIFVTAYTLTGQNLPVALWSAVSVGVLFTLIRVVRRESLQFAITGLVGIAIAAFIASRTGRAQDFFLPSLLKDVGLGLLYLVSIVVRWPLIGVIVGPLTGEGTTWRKDPARTRMYSKATWPWVGLFVVRLSVQLPLYFLGATVALGYVRVAMGIPLYLVTLWLSYAAIRSAPPMRTTDEVE